MMIYMDNRRSLRLSPRQREVLILYARGWTRQQVAGLLGIALGTVDSHTDRAYARLGACSMPHAIVLAIKEGVITIADIYPTPPTLHGQDQVAA